MSGSGIPSDSKPQSPAPGQPNRHVLTAVEKQRSQLDRLLKDPSKPAYVPSGPKEKTIRPAREMMKNVQGSSAGAGSGEFHVYKASRRREYERLKMMEDDARKEKETAEFERKRKEAEDLAEAKTAKNRAKRQKKKDRMKGKATERSGDGADDTSADVPLKKRRLVNGKELVFRRPGEDSEEEDEHGPSVSLSADAENVEDILQLANVPVAVEERRITIHEDE
ncbi:DUF1168-domain-containing protein [Coniophora puteana RWD-64-598 SS2]|uniref:DUF1168-domain-containing protein n=1 Tax=Coniophora puteana (strain RWD-64-598) TaxID=741705 RepID=A0A5M3MW19_CONPW|nr:DUF1168-domain-containing protein [Coniophora puteana RWD-64-598 SS2]EIW82924.1 DUF1168-domain-containing protein [Coniophora puteana RWD-64-598 SS2]